MTFYLEIDERTFGALFTIGNDWLNVIAILKREYELGLSQDSAGSGSKQGQHCNRICNLQS